MIFVLVYTQYIFFSHSVARVILSLVDQPSTGQGPPPQEMKEGESPPKAEETDSEPKEDEFSWKTMLQVAFTMVKHPRFALTAAGDCDC